MNHEYTDAAVEQRESHEDESQDWDLLFVGLACWFSFAVFFSFDFAFKRKANGRQKRFQRDKNRRWIEQIRCPRSLFLYLRGWVRRFGLRIQSEQRSSEKIVKAPGHSYPNALTKKIYLSAMTAKSSAEMASVKAVWMLVTSSRSSVCVYTHTRIAGVNWILFKACVKNVIHGSLLVFVKSPYLLYNIIFRLSMSMAVQFITILCCAFCAIYI